MTDRGRAETTTDRIFALKGQWGELSDVRKQKERVRDKRNETERIEKGLVIA
jgi:hypothetical protein